MEPRVTDKKTIGEKYGNKDALEKKSKNDKYKNVTSCLDTGKTIKDVQWISDQLVSKRRSEMFKRVKSSTIVKLLNQNPQTESIYNVGGDTEQINPNAMNDGQSVISSKTNNTAMSQQTSITAVTYATEMLGNWSEIDFILLDLREESEYHDYHIREAISFPGVLISRDKFWSQMIMMKNKESKMIIVYHNDERNGVPFAAWLFQKGYDNIYFLSGGIEEFVKHYPDYTDGPKRDILINMKIDRERQEQEALLKKTSMNKKGKTSINSTGVTAKNGMSSNNVSGISNNSVKSLKQGLQKK